MKAAILTEQNTPLVVANVDLPALDVGQVLVNVAYSVSQAATWKREIRALEAGSARFPDADRVLVTHERTLRTPPPGIVVEDAWRYLLGQPHEAIESGATSSRVTRKK